MDETRLIRMEDKVLGLETRLDDFGVRQNAFGVRLDDFGVRLDAFGARLDEFGVRLDEFGVRLDRFGVRLDEFGVRLDRFDVRLDAVGQDLRRLEQKVDTRMDGLEGHMLVLHEDLVDRIKALANPDAPTRREIKDDLDALREATNRRLDPLEGVAREHSREIDRLTRRDGPG